MSVVTLTHDLNLTHTHTHTHTHTRFTALFPGLPWWAGTRKVTPIWIFVKHETVSGSGISWAVCKSAPRSWQITTPAPPPTTQFFTDRMPFLPPNQQRQSTEDFNLSGVKILCQKVIESHSFERYGRIQTHTTNRLFYAATKIVHSFLPRSSNMFIVIMSSLLSFWHSVEEYLCRQKMSQVMKLDGIKFVAWENEVNAAYHWPVCSSEIESTYST